MFSIYAIAHIIINNTYVYTIGYTDRAMTHIVSCTQARAEFLKGGLRAVSHSFFSFIHLFRNNKMVTASHPYDTIFCNTKAIQLDFCHRTHICWWL